MLLSYLLMYVGVQILLTETELHINESSRTVDLSLRFAPPVNGSIDREVLVNVTVQLNTTGLKNEFACINCPLCTV